MKPIIVGLGAALSLSACGAVTCVARSTRVSTPRGLTPIEDLKEGDEVIVVEPHSGATTVSRIIAIRSSTRECGLLEIDGSSLCLTSDHPVFDPIGGAFRPAGDWLLGQRTQLLELTSQGVRQVKVSKAMSFARVAEVFDITVEHEWHTFVAEGIVVHNKSIQAQCEIPDGGYAVVSEPGRLCTCTDGQTGRWVCETPNGIAICSHCGMPDAGP